MASETGDAFIRDRLFGWTDDLTRRHYKILWASFLGWIFDGYETLALILAVQPILLTVLPATQEGNLTYYAGLAIGITLLGWATGGFFGGILTDYIGRKRMMVYSVLGYAIFTGLTALSTSFWMLAAFRFLTGLALGSEWETGTALLAETWPQNARAKGAGIMQSGFGFGSLIASLLWFFLQPLGPQSWRYLFAVGILPALFVLYLRTGIGESQMWLDVVEETEENGSTSADSNSTTDMDGIGRPQSDRMDASEASTEQDESERMFTLRTLLGNQDTRRLVILGSLLSLATTGGWWGINYLISGQAEAAAPSNSTYWATIAGIAFTIGAIVGYLVSGWIADSIGRRYYLWFIFIGGFIITPITFLWDGALYPLLFIIGVNGFFTLGSFAWFPIYLPELFTTDVRGSALGFIFNISRFVAFSFPILVGSIIATFGGPERTAVAFGSIYILGIIFTYYMPETRGQGLPDS